MKRNAKKALGRKMLSWMLALVMMVGMIPATFATPASAAESTGGAITEWEANALLAGAGTSVAQIALDNHYDDPNTDDYGMCGGNSHLQGIAVDDELKYMFFSYTSALAIIEIATGKLVASCGGFGQGSFGTPGGSHLGCIDYYDGYIYGSLEYKDPGKKFFLAIFDVERMLKEGVGVSVSEQNMEEPICTAVLLEEPTRDFRAPIDTTLFSGQDQFGHATNEDNNGHWFACSGIDGVSMGKWPGGKDDEIYMIVAYGVYQFSNSPRNDNTYNVLEYYKLSDIWNADGTQTQWNKTYTYTDGIHQDWAKDEAAWLSAAKTLYVYTGNTSYGSQNIEYEWDTGDVVLYTYGNTDNMGGTYYEVDGSVEPELKTLNLGQHSSNEWAQNVAKAYKNYPDAVAIDDDGYMMGYVGTLKCVCGKPENHTTEGNWPTGAPKADNFICSSSAPGSATTGIAWIGPDPVDATADWFYVADAALSTGLFKRTYDAKGGVAFSQKIWLEEEPLEATPVMHWTMDAADMDFEAGTLVNAVNGETYGGFFENVQVAKGMDGKDGGSLYFDGDADVLDYSRVWMDEDGIADLQAMVDETYKITVSFWYKPEFAGAANFTSDWSPILGIYSDARTVQPGQFVLVAEDRSSELRMCMNNYTVATNDQRSKGTTLHRSTDWHHIVMTVDLTRNYPDTNLNGGTSLYREFYVDGVKVGQDRALRPANKETMFDLLTDFEIGGAPYKCWSDSNVRGRFSGWIDDVKIYSTDVTDKQAAWLLQHEAKTADFDMSTLPEEQPTEIVETYVFDKANPADLTIGDVVVSKEALMQYQPGPATIEGETVYIINGADGYAMLNYALTADGTDSINGQDAAVINGVTFSNDGAFFRGYDETLVNRVQLSDTDFIDQAIADQATITFQFKSNRLVGNITNLVGLYDGARPGLVAQFRDSGGERQGGGEKVQFAGKVFTEDSKTWNGNVIATAADSLSLNDAWHTGAIVYDGAEMSVYLDGTLVATSDVADDALAGVDALVIGGPVNRNYASGVTSKSQQIMTNFYGTMKNVVVYNAALTAEQIAAGPNTALDISGLEYLVEVVKALNETDYTATSFAALAAPLAAAEAALADTALTQTALDKAAADLLAPYEALVDRADTAALEAAIAAAEALTEADYTADSWAALEAVLAEVAGVVTDPNAVQANADEAEAAVEAAVEALVDRADTAALEAAIAAAEALTEADYTANSWAALEAVLAEVAGVVTDPNAVQADADEAEAAVEAAVEALVDISDLAAIVAETAALEKGKFTGTSWAAIPDTLAAAETVLADPAATKEAVAAATEALDAAVAALKAAPKNEDPIIISNITVEAGIGGTAKADYVNAPAGTEVTITATPDEGKKVASITVNGEAIDGNTFKMPAKAVTVVVTFADAGEHICPSEKFDDVDTSLWYHNAIDYVVANGLMAGVADDAFAPNATTTRGMIVTILYSLEGKPAASGDAFSDVKSGDWYFNAVNWAAANGIVSGYGDDKFGPNDNVTREQLVAILKAYAVYKGVDVSVGENTNILSYSDFDQISEWAIPAVQWGCGAGIISGKSADTLDPTGNALRCEVAQMMMKFVALI